MGNDVLTLQEVAELLGKSTQTIRRMIKKGDLKAQRIRTAQGFQYGIYRGQVPGVSAPSLPAQKPLVDEAETRLTSQLDTPMDRPSEELVTQEDVAAALETDYYILEPEQNSDVQRLLEVHHREKMLLIHILENLQMELRAERAKPKSILEWVREKTGF